MNNKFNNKTFPFENYEAFKKANSDGSVVMGVDHKVAIDWLLYKGKYCYSFWWINGLIFSWIPVVIIVGFLVVMFFISRLLLITFPLLIIAILLQNPFVGQKKFSRAEAHSRSLFWLITNTGFLYSLLINHLDWVWVFGAMIGIFISWWFVKKFALECFFTTAANHEDFLMELYQKDIISLKFTR